MMIFFEHQLKIILNDLFYCLKNLTVIFERCQITQKNSYFIALVKLKNLSYKPIRIKHDYFRGHF